MDNQKYISIYYLKTFIMNLYVYYSFKKLSNIKYDNIKRKILIYVLNIIVTFICMYIEFNVSSLLSVVIAGLVYVNILSWLFKEKIGNTLVIVIISYAICSICLVISTLTLYFPYIVFKVENLYINTFFILLLQFIFLYLLVRIRKIKNGLDFIKQKFNSDFADIVLINISIAIILITCLLGTIFESIEEIRKNLLITFFILAFTMCIIIYKTLTMYYKQKLLNDALFEYEETIKQISKSKT